MSEIQGIHVYRGTAISDEDFFGKSDFYFVCRIGSIGSSWSEKTRESNGFQIRSTTVKNSLDPEWNAFFSFDLAQDWAKLCSLISNRNEKGLEMTLKIYDEDIIADDFLGIVTVTLPKNGQQDATAFPVTGESGGGTGTVTISFNLVDDINLDSPLQNVTYTGWPKSRQDIRYLTHWLSKIQNSVGDFEDFFEKIGDFGMGHSILHKKEGLKAFDMTPDQITKYFENTEDHPKYKQIDTNTKFFHENMVNAVRRHKKCEGDRGMKTVEEICLPKPKKELEYITIEEVQGLKIPKDDEKFEAGVLDTIKTTIVFGIDFIYLKMLPFEDVPFYFESEEEAVELCAKHFPPGLLLPPNETFEDLTSDEAISNIAFYGFGQVLLKRSTTEETNYEVDTTALSSLPVRPEYANLGAKAVFAENTELLHIFVSNLDKIVLPGDEEWEHAKFAWKVSLMDLITIGPHLGHCHWIISNLAHIASRTTLGANHPVRRVLKVFIYNTGLINISSTFGLWPENSFLHRMSGLTYEGLSKAFKMSAENFKYEKLSDFIESKNLGEDIGSKIPLCTDAPLIWNAFLKFFQSYIDIFYADDESVASDKELIEFWECVDSRGKFGSPSPYGLPTLDGKDNLIEYLTHLAFNVTAWHEMVGTISQYVTRPSGFGFSLRPGKAELDVQSFVQAQCLVGNTGMRNPQLMSDWKHLLPDREEVIKLHDDLMEDLGKISASVDERNEERPHKSQIFNPKFLETSVSI